MIKIVTCESGTIPFDRENFVGVMLAIMYSAFLIKTGKPLEERAKLMADFLDGNYQFYQINEHGTISKLVNGKYEALEC